MTYVIGILGKTSLTMCCRICISLKSNLGIFLSVIAFNTMN